MQRIRSFGVPFAQKTQNVKVKYYKRQSRFVRMTFDERMSVDRLGIEFRNLDTLSQQSVLVYQYTKLQNE